MKKNLNEFLENQLFEMAEIGSPFSGWSVNIQEKEIPVPHFHLVKEYPEIKIAIAIKNFQILPKHSKPENIKVSSKHEKLFRAFLVEPSKANPNLSNWQILLTQWNIMNPNKTHRVDTNLKIPSNKIE